MGGAGIKLAVKITVEDDTATVDFTGTDRQVRSALNDPANHVRSIVYESFWPLIGPDVPIN